MPCENVLTLCEEGNTGNMTINEIAELAGVSRATVSRYLNKGYVSEEKKEKIRKVVEETGYRPSVSAQTLRKRITGMIGVIIPKIASDTISHMISGINEVLTAEGYKMLLADTNDDAQEELRYLEFFNQNQVDGVIHFGTMMTPKHYELLHKLNVPNVVIGQKADGIPCVYQNDYQSMYEMSMQFLKSAKHVAFIGAPDADLATGTTRKRAFGDALISSGFKLSDAIWKQGDFGMECGRTLMAEIMKECPEVDTVITATDEMAIGAMLWCMEQDIRIPEQIQISGTGDTTLGRVIRPSLSTVVFEYREAGRRVAELLVQLIRREEPEKTDICMPYHLEFRESLRV